MIIITGMHRSGTSMVAQLLLNLGIPFGDSSGFCVADHWNERGYIEQKEIADLNSILITHFPNNQSRLLSMFSKLVYTTMPNPSKIEKQVMRKRDEIIRMGSKYQHAAVKDPRFCLTLSGWKKLVSIEKVVVCLRHPAEIVFSLKRRQNYPIAMGYRFWRYHIQALIDATDDIETLYIDYNNLSGNNPRNELDRFYKFFSLCQSNSSLDHIYREVVDPRLRHHKADSGAVIPEGARELWKELKYRYRCQQ